MGGISWNSEVKGAFLDWNSEGILAGGGRGVMQFGIPNTQGLLL